MMSNNEKKLYSVKEVSELWLIWFKERKIREFLKSWKLKWIQIPSWQRKIVKISQESIDEFMEKYSEEYK